LLQGGGVRARECIEPTTIFFSPSKKITTKKKSKKTKKPKERTGGIALAHADDRRRQ